LNRRKALNGAKRLNGWNALERTDPHENGAKRLNGWNHWNLGTGLKENEIFSAVVEFKPLGIAPTFRVRLNADRRLIL